MFRTEKRDKVDIVSFTGDRINALGTEELLKGIESLLHSGSTRLVINLKGVQYIDSSGFGCLLSIMKTARNHYCSMKVASPEAQVLEVLKTLNLHTIMEIHEDLDECVRSLA
ncbi:MAG: STAS domain-containing protein [Bacteroidales bacterium]|nr:STAS domain-containing protein [Bacteroidales bacterium]MBN2633880.1 STAS domain-containing protein [Bacteroidales bacterium]